MSFIATLSDNGKQLTIELFGELDYKLQEELQATYSEMSENVSTVKLDLKNVDFLHSASLGGLLALKEVVKENTSIKIINANDDILNTLNITQFGRFFDIDGIQQD